MNAFRQSSWIVTLSLAGVAVAYVMLIWMPGHRAIKEMISQLDNQRQFLSQAATLSAAVNLAQRQLEQAEAVCATWQKRAPGKRDVPRLYGKINALAKEAGLSIGRFDPQPFVIYEKLHEIPLTVTCTGSFAQVFEFLQKLESLPPTIWVESLKAEKSVQDAKDVQCELSLVVFSDNSETSGYTKDIN